VIQVRMATIIDSGVLIAANRGHLNYDGISTRYEKEDMAIIGGRSSCTALTRPCMTNGRKHKTPGVGMNTPTSGTTEARTWPICLSFCHSPSDADSAKPRLK
jgi:hypothetical protein